MRSRDFISIRDFTPEDIHGLISLACEMKVTPAAFADMLRGKVLAMIFEKPSLRTRVSFDVGMRQLGGSALYLSPAEIRLGERETVYDVAKNLERMVQGIMMRTFSHARIEEMAEHADVPVINGLSNFSHPCQAMADYLTILEFKGKLAGVKVAFVGDGNNVAHSLLFAGAQLGVHLAIASPPGYEPNANAMDWAARRASQTGAQCTFTHDPVEAMSEADVVYTDVWASMGQEGEAEERRRIFSPYQVNAQLFAQAKRDAVFMHCLPAHRGEEVAAEVIDSPRSIVFAQAENRLHAQKAILVELMKDVQVTRPSLAAYRVLTEHLSK
jgi:ornithine carbamoyltransferase